MNRPEQIRAWLLERYGEDEWAAQAVRPLGHTYDMGGNRLDDVFAFGRVIWAAEDGSPERTTDGSAAAHFRRHHPARILREVAAKRHRLVRREVVSQDRDILCAEVTDEPICDWCTDHWAVREGDGRRSLVFWPCPDIIDDAQAYAERDDFPEELRLDGN